jgi:hypothetical protein
MGVIGIFKKFPSLPTITKLRIADACVRSTALYGLEVTRLDDMGNLKKKLNIVLRRAARAATSMPNACANQILQLDLGMRCITTEMKVRKLKLLHKALNTPESNPLFAFVME